MQIIAIDWSGEKSGGSKKIWTAESSNGYLRSLETGKTRDEVADHLIDLAIDDPAMVVGFDFAFSMPDWFVRSQGATSAKEFWGIAEGSGESWLNEGPIPFFGRKAGSERPAEERLFRRTEKEIPKISGLSAKSVFQIGGGGHVGTGSIRGMPILKRLSAEGFRVWPFDTPVEGKPLIVEIYPRLLTGAVVKNDFAARMAHLENYAARIGTSLRKIAAQDEDQFDAAVSAVVMNRFLNELVALDAGDEVNQLEGRIWHPADSTFHAGEPLPNFLDPGIPEETFALNYVASGIIDGPFQPELTQVMDWDGTGPDGTVGLATSGIPLHLRVLQRDGDRLYTADGEWIRLIPESQLPER